jgi:hypothetical protein
MQLVKVESGDGHVGRRVLQTQTSEVLKENNGIFQIQLQSRMSWKFFIWFAIW